MYQLTWHNGRIEQADSFTELEAKISERYGAHVYEDAVSEYERHYYLSEKERNERINPAAVIEFLI
jgi:hypothetical protein